MKPAEEARHICRACGFVVEPGAQAHTKMRLHVRTEHPGFFVAVTCWPQCGFRATSEGRYTAEYTPKGQAAGGSEKAPLHGDG